MPLNSVKLLLRLNNFSTMSFQTQFTSPIPNIINYTNYINLSLLTSWNTL